MGSDSGSNAHSNAGTLSAGSAPLSVLLGLICLGLIERRRTGRDKEKERTKGRRRRTDDEGEKGRGEEALEEKARGEFRPRAARGSRENIRT